MITESNLFGLMGSIPFGVIDDVPDPTLRDEILDFLGASFGILESIITSVVQIAHLSAAFV